MAQLSPSHHPTTGRLDVVAAVSNYLTSLGRAPSAIHLTGRQWDAFRRDAPRRPELGIAPAHDTALSFLINGIRHVVPVEIVEPEPSDGVSAYRRQYEAENTPDPQNVLNNTLSGAPAHA